MKPEGLIVLICAWVLWQESTGITATSLEKQWDIIGAFEASASCEGRAQLENERIKKNLSETKDPATPGIVTLFRTVCVPDTIDPRPRK